MSHTRAIHYRTVRVDDVDIFYREAGAADAPVILLLHGFPTSSHMFRDLLPLLSDRYRLIAPDYPGFGYSSTPSPKDFDYTFAHLTDVIAGFTDALGLRRYALYAQDFGGPVGFRLASRRPERISALIVQNANAYEDGLTPYMRDLVLGIWKHRTAEAEARLQTLFELRATQRQYLEGVRDLSLVSPDSWAHAQWGLDRPGNKHIQFALHVNYGSNLEMYSEWHSYFRRHQPPTLVVWGANDPVFACAGASAYRKDLKTVELRILDTGHFALETHVSEIAHHVGDFLSRYGATTGTSNCARAGRA